MRSSREVEFVNPINGSPVFVRGQVHLMRSPKGVEFVSPINCPPGSVVIVMCHDDHQKMKGFLIGYGSWDFTPHLMGGGSATRVVATLRVLTSGVNSLIV